MGRRPNAVVFQFFERGRKLEDSSNRYEHSCRRCGELFPKGRVDSLIGHILRRCPNFSQHDRDVVKSQIKHDAAQRNLSRSSVRSATGFAVAPVTLQSDFMSSNLPNASLPGQQQQSALDTLAEVSRQQLDYSSQQPNFNHGNEQHEQDDARDLVEQTLLAHLRGAVANENSLNNFNIYLPVEENSSNRDSLDIIPHTDTIAPSPLVQAASAANEELEQVQSRQLALSVDHSTFLDPQLGRGNTSTVNHSTGGGTSTDGLSLWEGVDDVDSRVADTDTTILAPAPDLNVGGYGLFASTTCKARARNKFTDTRRKEVQEIRKRGACIRCRMLKKPCSEGTPCETCARVESARLWKGKCLRTRIADEFVLWSTGYFHSRASIDVSAALYDYSGEPLPGRISVRLFSGSTACMTFACREYKRREDTTPREHQSETPLYLLDEGEGMSAKILEYMQEVLTVSIADETNAFLQATLQEAQRFALQEGTSGDATNGTSSGRSCYSLHDDLVTKAIELWAETRLLTAPHSISLQLQYTLESELAKSVEKASEQQNIGITGVSKPISPNSDSGNLIQSQLLAATESRCSRLSQSLMHDIERRLLQRQQVSGLATFISAVLLLNCVERMTGLFRSFDVGVDDQATDGTDGALVMPANWPLDLHPRKLWTQGRHFAELLIMLLRMRGLPPATACTEDGLVVTKFDSALPVGLNGQPTRGTNDDRYSAAAAWLDPVQLKVDDLFTKHHGSDPGPDAGVQAWDMKFISGLLLPSMMV